MPQITITDATFLSFDIEQAILQSAGGKITKSPAITAAALGEAVASADAVITQFAPVTAEVIARMSRARAIVRYGIGVDNVDLDAARELGIPVCNVPDYCIDEVADHTLALLLSCTRKIDTHAGRVRQGEWKLAVEVGAMRALSGATVGILGYGRIGREVARRLAGFKCRLLVFDPLVRSDVVQDHQATGVDLDTLFAESDAITLHCPSTPATRRLINADSLARMKHGATLINVGRGDLVDPTALVAALESGKLAAAGLDVTDPEPLPADSPLRRMEQVSITPHIASVSTKAVRALREAAANAALIALRGELPPNIVNGVTQPRQAPA